MGWSRRKSLALASFESRETGHWNCPAAVLRTNWKNGGRKKISFSGNWLSHPARYIGKSKGTQDDVRIFAFSMPRDEIL